jgi:hypothetical protein
MRKVYPTGGSRSNLKLRLERILQANLGAACYRGLSNVVELPKSAASMASGGRKPPDYFAGGIVSADPVFE